MNQFLKTAAIAAVLFVVALTLHAEPNSRETDTIPGYYEFFMKTGKLVRLKTEIKRDQQIAAGELKPQQMSTPLPKWKLADSSGKDLDVHSLLDKRNLLIVSFRSWW